MSANVIGAILMMVSTACFTINDTFLKATDGDVPLFQLLFLRGVLATAFIGAVAWMRVAFSARLSRQDWGLIALRSLSEFAAAYFFVTALLHMPLANVTAILQILPLAVTLGSALFFGERVGWRRMAAIAVGFCGMLMIVRPGSDGFSLWSIYALAAVACVTARDLSTRRMSAQAPTWLITFSASCAVMILSGGASLTSAWAPITPHLAALILGSALFIVGGYFFSVQVMRQGDISFTASFRYSGLLWALVLGWLVFGDWPDTMTLLGGGVIVATGLFTLYRERVKLAR